MQLIVQCASLEQLLGHHEEAHSRLAAALTNSRTDSSSEAVALSSTSPSAASIARTSTECANGASERSMVARPLGDLPLTAASTAVLAVADTFTGHVPDAEAHSSEAAAQVTSLSDGELGHRLDALANLCAAELYLHRYPEAAAHARRGIAIGRATGQGNIAPVLVPVLGNVLHMWGRIAESAELLDEAIDVARLSGNAESSGWNLLGRSFTALAAGDVTLALSTAARGCGADSQPGRQSRLHQRRRGARARALRGRRAAASGGAAPAWPQAARSFR